RARRPRKHRGRCRWQERASLTFAGSMAASDNSPRLPSRSVIPENARGRAAQSCDRSDLDHVGQIMTKQILDAMPQGRGRGWAPGTSPLHIQINNPVLEAAKRDVTAIIRNRRPHPGLDQFLDCSYGLGVLCCEKFVSLGCGCLIAIFEKRRARHEMLHDDAQDCRLEMLPFTSCLGHCNKIGTEENAGDAI